MFRIQVIIFGCVKYLIKEFFFHNSHIQFEQNYLYQKKILDYKLLYFVFFICYI